MKHQRIRTAAIAASTLGVAFGATFVSVAGAQAVARPDVQAVWACQSLTSPFDGLVTGYTCHGSPTRTGIGWFELPTSGGAEQIEYVCTSFSPTLETSDLYTVNGSGCTPYA